MSTAHPSRRSMLPRSAFATFRFPPEVIVPAMRWYLRFGLSYRDVEELLPERGIEVDHVTIYRWFCSSRWSGADAILSGFSTSTCATTTTSDRTEALRFAHRGYRYRSGAWRGLGRRQR